MPGTHKHAHSHTFLLSHMHTRQWLNVKHELSRWISASGTRLCSQALTWLADADWSLGRHSSEWHHSLLKPKDKNASSENWKKVENTSFCPPPPAASPLLAANSSAVQKWQSPYVHVAALLHAPCTLWRSVCASVKILQFVCKCKQV